VCCECIRGELEKTLEFLDAVIEDMPDVGALHYRQKSGLEVTRAQILLGEMKSAVAGVIWPSAGVGTSAQAVFGTG